jgi:hypothetical protein
MEIEDWKLEIGDGKLEIVGGNVETWNCGTVEPWYRGGDEERNSPSAGENLGLGNTTG